MMGEGGGRGTTRFDPFGTNFSPLIIASRVDENHLISVAYILREFGHELMRHPYHDLMARQHLLQLLRGHPTHRIVAPQRIPPADN